MIRSTTKGTTLLVLACLTILISLSLQGITQAGNPFDSPIPDPTSPCLNLSQDGYTLEFFGYYNHGNGSTSLVYRLTNDNRRDVGYTAFGTGDWGPIAPADDSTVSGNLGDYRVEWTNDNGNPGFASIKFEAQFDGFSQGVQDTFTLTVSDFDTTAPMLVQVKAGRDRSTFTVALDAVACNLMPKPTPIPTTTPPTPAVLVTDAKAYVAMMCVDMDEAIRRLNLQNEIGELNRQLSENEGNTFAGLWIQHQPHYRIMIRFTRDGEATLQSYVRNTSLVDIVELHQATATLTELETVRSEAALIANELGIRASSAINVSTNQAELYVLDPTELDEQLSKANIQLPENVEVIQFTELPREVTDIFGGKALTSCTSGFSVMDTNSGIQGVTTAGHCSNTQVYNGTDLPFISGTTGGIYDIQWHRGDHAFTVRNLIWDGSYCTIYGPVDHIYNILGLIVLPAKTYLPLVMR